MMLRTIAAFLGGVYVGQTQKDFPSVEILAKAVYFNTVSKINELQNESQKKDKDK
jgi:hypothetical protein